MHARFWLGIDSDLIDARIWYQTKPQYVRQFTSTAVRWHPISTKTSVFYHR